MLRKFDRGIYKVVDWIFCVVIGLLLVALWMMMLPAAVVWAVYRWGASIFE